MAKTQKAKEKNQIQLEINDQTQTPPSRQAGANQPLPQDIAQSGESAANRSGGGSGSRGLARRENNVNPFSFMRRFSEEMDRLFEDFGFGSNLLSPRSGGRLLSELGRFGENAFDWSPQTEVFVRGSELIVRADLPGLTKDDINVDLEDDRIIIRGERRHERDQSDEGFYHTERSYGSFYRSIPLPEGVDGENANATFQNGVLEITLPLPEQKPRSRRIEIGGGSGGG